MLGKLFSTDIIIILIIIIIIIIIWSCPLSDVNRVTASKQFALPALDSKIVLVFFNYLDIFINCILLSLILSLCFVMDF